MKRSIKGKDLESVKKWIKKVIIRWYDVKPDYIFLSDTRDTLFGWPLREAWKKTYPKDKPPKFYRIDPMAFYGLGGHKRSDPQKQTISWKESQDFFSKRIKKKKPTVILFELGADVDEVFRYQDITFEKGIAKKSGVRSGGSLGLIYPAIRHYLGKYLTGDDKWAIKNSNLDIGNIYLCESGAKPIYNNSFIHTSEGWFSKSPVSKFSYSSGRNPTQDESFQLSRNPPARPNARIVKHPEQRKRASAYVKELKQIGKEAGEELYHELEKKKTLENFVSGILTFGAIGFLIYNLNSSVTGFVISNTLTEPKSIIPVIIILGVAGYLIWKRKWKNFV
jgi:hypothetical protein